MLPGLTPTWSPSAAPLTAEAVRGFASPAFRWALAPAIAAWVVMASLELCGASLPVCGTAAAGPVSSNNVVWASQWLLMLAAMMLPLLVPMIGHVAVRSFAARRDRSVGLFLTGYSSVWFAAAAALSTVFDVIGPLLGQLGLAGETGMLGCAIAALWQISPAKRRAVNRCHGTVALRAWGTAADHDAVRFGLLHGMRCVRACLPTMLAAMLGGAGLMAMAVVFAILLAERARRLPQYRLSAIALLLLGLIG